MSKKLKTTIGLGILAAAIISIGADRIFVSADAANYSQSITILTSIALFLFLVAAVWLFGMVMD